MGEEGERGGSSWGGAGTLARGVTTTLVPLDPGQGVVSKKEMPRGVQAGEEGRKGEKVAVRSLHQDIGRGDPFPGVLIFNIVEQGRLKTENLRRFSNASGERRERAGTNARGLTPF